MEYDPFLKSQLASRSQLKGLMWCKFDNVTLEYPNEKNLGLHRVVRVETSVANILPFRQNLSKPESSPATLLLFFSLLLCSLQLSDTQVYEP